MLIAQDSFRPHTIDDLIDARLAARLDAMDILSRKMLAGKLPGERRSKRRGRSVEFDDFRNYVPGDDLRHIDWNVYARLDRLFIKLFREEEDLSLTVAVDVSASMDAGKPSKMIFAARLAAALSYIGLVNQNRVSCAAFGLSEPPGIRQLAPTRGRTGMHRVTELLVSAVNDASRRSSATLPMLPFADVMKQVSKGQGGRGVLVVISDWLMEDGGQKGLEALGHATMTGRLDAYAVQVLSPGEDDPASQATAGLSGDLQLTDVETGRDAGVTVSPASIAQYRSNLKDFQAKWRSVCLRNGVAPSVARSDASVEDLVMNTLRRGGMIG